VKAEPAQSISLDGEAIVSGAKLCSVRESPTEIVSTLVTGPGEEVSQSPIETVSTLSAVSQPCQGGGAGVSGAESHPVLHKLYPHCRLCLSHVKREGLVSVEHSLIQWRRCLHKLYLQ
jgi:hypothetical protein